MLRHYVTFVSPGTLFSETTTKIIDSWDIKKATKMADKISERYGATPYAFYFQTFKNKNEINAHKQSNTYYLGGRIETIDDVRKRQDPNEKILLWNMEGNNWDKIIVNDNSYRSITPLREGDVILDYTPPTKRKKRK